jgi:hypothetical protein
MAMRTIEENHGLLTEIAEAQLERETLDREEVDLLLAGEPLPEVKVVRHAREFAESLRRNQVGTAPRPEGGVLPEPVPEPGT